MSAIRKLLGRPKIESSQVDLWEINEAFAAMALSVLHHLPEMDRERVNVHGGAIAYGHPLGASFPRVIVDAVPALARAWRRRGRGGGLRRRGPGHGGRGPGVKIA